MPASIKHKFACAIPDDPAAAAAGMVLPSHFNDEHDATGLPLLHGFVYPTASSVTSTPFNNTTRTFTLAAGAGYDVFIGGALLHITAALTVAIGTGLGQHFIWMTAAGALVASQNAWDILDTTVTPVATIHWDGATGIVGDERHDSRRNLLEHRNQHESWGAQYVSGFSPAPTFASANTFSFAGGVIRDEELYHSLTGTQTTCQVGYRVSGGATMTFDASGTGYAKLNGGVPQYDNGGTLTNLGSGKYGVYWIYATNRPSAPLVSIVGQGEYATATAAQASVQPTLAGFTVAEWKLLYRVIVRNTGGALVFSQADVLYNLNSGPAIQAGAPSTVVAGNVTFVPAGNIAATNVQAALEELDTEKVSKALPVMTGIPAETAVAKGSVSGTQALDLSAGSLFTATATGACAWNFTNPPAGVWSATLILTNGGAGAQTWQVGGSARTPKWIAGAAPALSTSGVDIIEVLSPDGGTTLYGFLAGKGFA